ncbi:hypothetical protein [Bdellovibrio sp. ZAP7]|uniref:hypothetical protein n=1 Tax=Bdellovibrio sp. ZAP7 TaxID=2231053 RepID=UPI0011576FEB|nr:hypothetical protein [Bdellovibrio sp. ZAP7]
MRTAIQIITVLLGFFLIFQATAAEAAVELKGDGYEKLSGNLKDHEMQVGWAEPIKKMKCKLISHVAVDDFTGQAANKMKAMTSLEWKF